MQNYTSLASAAAGILSLSNRNPRAVAVLSLIVMTIFLGFASANEAQAYSISGTVTNTSSASGWVYLSLDQGSSNFNGLGTSVWLAAAGNAGNSASFSIGGVPGVPGATMYVINAFLDNVGSGIQYANSSTGSHGNISFNNSNIAGIDVSLAWPSPAVALGINVPNPNIFTTVTTSGFGAAIVIDKKQMQDNNGLFVPESLDIYWGYALNSLSNTFNVPLGQNSDVFFLNGSNSSGPLYVQIVPRVKGVADAAHASQVTQATIATPTDGSTVVTGTVTSTGVTLGTGTGTPLYVALVPAQNGNGNPYVTYVKNPVNPQTYTITGVPAGTYNIFAMLDMNNNHVQDFGDLTDSDNNSNGPTITVDGSSPYTAPDIALAAVNSVVATIGTQHYRSSNGSNNSDFFSLNISVNPGAKLPVSATITAGPQLTSLVPVNLVWNANWGNIQGWLQLPARPSVGDNYTVHIEYFDGTSPSDLPMRVTAVLDNFAIPIYPANNTAPINGTSLFAWTTPQTLPAGYYDYQIQVQDATNYNQVWSPQNNSSNMPANQLSVTYNSDNSANPPSLVAGNNYFWNSVVVDSLGNQATYQANFTPQQSGPTIGNFAPTTGTGKIINPLTPGTTVVIPGSGFISGSTTVNFGGVSVQSGDFTVDSSAQITAQVPSAAPVGPITVNVNGTTAGSSTQFIPTVTLQGTASTSGSPSTALGGHAETIGLSPFYTEIFNDFGSSGSGYSLPGVPSGVPLTIHITSPGGYLDTYSSIMSPVNSIVSPIPGYTMWTIAALNNKGIDPAPGDSGKGLILSRVANWDNTQNCASGVSGGCVPGAVVTATSKLHPLVPYTVAYTLGTPSTSTSVGGSFTNSDGKFYVLNVDDGDYVAVTASLSGYGFETQTFITHANSVSATKVKGTPLPTVSPSPAGGTYGLAQSVTLTAGSAAACTGFGGCTIYYTTDGSDPTAPGSSVQSASSPVIGINVDHNLTLRYFAVNGHGISGPSDSASYIINGGGVQYTLTANSDGSGSGTLSSTTPGVSCNSNSCSGNMNSGTTAVITANGGPGSTYTTWTGCNSVNGNQCNVTMDSPKTVTATFMLNQQLTVNATGSGSGSVSSSIGGISYSFPGQSTDSTMLNYGANVTLTATAISGSTVVWSGDCNSISGAGTTNATCTINNMNSAETEAAIFSSASSCSNPSVWLAGTSYYYNTIHETYTHVSSEGQSIRIQASAITDSPTFNGTYGIKLQGGFDCNYGSNSGVSTVHGSIIISGGSVTVENVIVQ